MNPRVWQGLQEGRNPLIDLIDFSRRIEMNKIQGKYAEAIVYTDDLEEYAKAQIQLICDNEISRDTDIRVMPDVHPGKVGPIGLTLTNTHGQARGVAVAIP